MYLKSAKGRLLMQIMEQAACGELGAEMRAGIGTSLLELLEADHFASFLWDEDARRFKDCVSLNMSDKNLDRYDAYYQFCNPISPISRQRRSATLVSQLIPQHELVRTEFYTDFLRKDGLHYGLNLYIHEGSRNTGDIRLWRGKSRPPFDTAAAATLDSIAPFFAAGLRNWKSLCDLRTQTTVGVVRGLGEKAFESLGSTFNLTDREIEVTKQIVTGRSDNEIGIALAISVATVRTHLRKLYSKLRVHRRTQILQRVLESRLSAIAGSDRAPK